MATPTRSDRFRRRVADVYVVEDMLPADLELLDEIAATMDNLDRLREALRDTPLTEVRQGGVRVSPLQVEARLMSQALAGLLARFPELD